MRRTACVPLERLIGSLLLSWPTAIAIALSAALALAWQTWGHLIFEAVEGAVRENPSAWLPGILGFGGLAGASIEIAKIIFFIAVVLFLVSAVVGLARGRTRV